MENLLREYLERSFADRTTSGPRGTGPVVTLSREFGCPSKAVAQLLTAALNRQPGAANDRKWRFINKEVLEATARQLELSPVDVGHLLNATGKGVVEEIDRNRMNLFELVTGEKFSPFLFDVSYHCHALSGEEIVASIVGLMESKRMI